MIHRREVERWGLSLVEYERDGVPTVVYLLPEKTALCDGIQNEDARWKCLKAVRMASIEKKTENAT